MTRGEECIEKRKEWKEKEMHSRSILTSVYYYYLNSQGNLYFHMYILVFSFGRSSKNHEASAGAQEAWQYVRFVAAP